MPGNVLLSHGRTTLSSALSSFTSEFGMDSGGTHSLMSPGKLVWPNFNTSKKSAKFWINSNIVCTNSFKTQNTLVLYGQASRAISTG